MSAAAPHSEYVVEIRYREPTYEAHAGRKAEPYSWRYRITAGTEDEARAQALGQFNELAAVSSVGWVREVVGISVKRPDPGPKTPRA